MFSKHKSIRLSGCKMAKLNSDIHQRDNHSCIICGCFVPDGIKFHHVYQGADKSDCLECGVTLCNVCHNHAHSGHNGEVLEIKEKCKNYLTRLYKKQTC